MIMTILLVLLGIAVVLVTALIRTRIWNDHKKKVTSGEMTEADYNKEVEQFGIYTPKPKQNNEKGEQDE